MTSPSKTEPVPNRGEIWWIRFDPSEGAEIGKTRPAVVVNVPSVGRLRLRIVVPITDWQPKWITVPWLVYLKKNQRNGLKKDSAADCFQVKSVSLNRFESRIGRLTEEEVEQISAGVSLCIGAP
ncbi:MAG TPA: type II toxin-antitoxin system PemK/MazF family toxin [Planctomycetota bacterium]|nr:type II toxin-antitoxin system PemK/MazF family toxin [Planctomycetota bacterium]NMD34688.1 type II toxin-antitoxin system PemK/MazF family toxin [Planctomycetota bacterium]HNR99358.1 type II toxin-antitoxin system PemK/MazF family toxin [Planctomycetota bacterium]HNU26826.1 type II toxin-antitoxin system PemK/MazF family toxin [Planctomycetota bacterium]HOE30048.1 type II toxin-antitoxin system PemK/MazF family toxin [Planctomycetota bacterium]